MLAWISKSHSRGLAFKVSNIFHSNRIMSIILCVIIWLHFYPPTSNSSSPEGKSHLKPSVDQKIVLWLHTVKLIILDSKYWGLHALLSQNVFIYWAHLCKLSIYPYVSSSKCFASCSTPEQYFCAQISYPQIKLSSVWEAHEGNKQAADQCWLPQPLSRHHYFTQIPNHPFWSHASVQRRRDSGKIFLFQRLQLLHSILQQS